jgi:UDP-N-acetylglucosamine--N-acetylmuramyl-(pentapeptide) pyrophosphoryl-undecaprenol N-acetylglucosamine transferase
MTSLTIVIAGGGTGGHLYPGIAVAREIQRRVPAAKISFAGTSRGLESRIVPREGFELDLIRAAGIKGKSVGSRLRGVLLVPAGLFDAWRVIGTRRPDVVVGVGGYSSGPVVLAAAMRRIPTMILEQNAAPGLTNRMLAPFVRAAAVTYAQTLSFFGRRGFVTGNPVRAEFFQRSNFELRPSAGSGRPEHAEGRTTNFDKRRVLILGGSQGAHAINMAMVAAAPRLVRSLPGLEVVHQTGQRDLAKVREEYQRAGIPARAESFFDAVAGEMTAADLVICRSGASTLAELAAAGRPAVLIPFPAATDDHQRKNAKVLADAGAAVLIDEKDLSPERLGDEAASILAEEARQQAMSGAMSGFARPDAATRIVDRILALARYSEGAAA